MEKHSGRTVTLNICMDPAFLPVATSFVENSAIAMGLGQAESLSLTLASEEIFAYLCRSSSGEDHLSIRCSQGGYCVRTEFSFPMGDFNMRSFNLTATLSLDEESDLEEMGLLIASRSVDHFHIVEEMGTLHLSLVKEKKYPGIESGEEMKVNPIDRFSIKGPNEEELKLFARLVASYYKGHIILKDLKYPGKLVDMVQWGEYQCLLAFDREGHMGGGILWHWAGIKTIECLGPYLFNQGANSMANELLEACLKAIAKTRAIGLINRLPTADLPLEHFEPLGYLTFFNKDKLPINLTAYFRHMDEDPGLVVWSHQDLEDWLKGEYRRLVFPREIQRVADAGETVNSWSVLLTEFDRFNRMATLRPIRYGKDAGENLMNHLELLQRESFRRVFFEMDLGIPWQTRFTPALLNSDFRPRLILPYAGEGDLVVFQWGEAS